MPGLTPNLDDPAEKPWTVYEFCKDPNALESGGILIGVFYATTAEEATALACEDEPWLDRDLLIPYLAWLVPRTPWDKQRIHASGPGF